MLTPYRIIGALGVLVVVIAIGWYAIRESRHDGENSFAVVASEFALIEPGLGHPTLDDVQLVSRVTTPSAVQVTRSACDASICSQVFDGGAPFVAQRDADGGEAFASIEPILRSDSRSCRLEVRKSQLQQPVEASGSRKRPSQELGVDFRYWTSDLRETCELVADLKSPERGAGSVLVHDATLPTNGGAGPPVAVDHQGLRVVLGRDQWLTVVSAPDKPFDFWAKPIRAASLHVTVGEPQQFALGNSHCAVAAGKEVRFEGGQVTLQNASLSDKGIHLTIEAPKNWIIRVPDSECELSVAPQKWENFVIYLCVGAGALMTFLSNLVKVYEKVASGRTPPMRWRLFSRQSGPKPRSGKAKWHRQP